jgi:hypothetical protein
MSPNTKYEIKNTRPGSTILMALLILATVLIIAVSIAEVVRMEVVSGRASDYAAFATYAAESQFEDSLYRLRKNPATTVASLDGTQMSFANGATTRLQAQNYLSALTIPPGFAAGETSTFFLYDYDTGTSPAKQSIVVYPHCNSAAWWFEVGYADWTPGNAFNTVFQKFRYSCAGLSWNSPVVISGLSAVKAYQVYVKALNATFTDGMSVTACDDPAGTLNCDMPGSVTLTSAGTYRGSNRTLILTMPRSSPVSGLWSYAVFSECQLIKDPLVLSPPC